MRARLLGWMVAVLWGALSTTAAAQEPAPASTPAPAVSQNDDTSWRNRYAVARERLLAGDFADAASRFDQLAREAPDANSRSLAESLRDLARSWARRGLTLVRRSYLGESTLPAKSVGERTTDEIAELYASSILYGVGTGLWLDQHTNADTAGGVVLPMVLFSGVAAGTVALLDVGHPLKYGVPQSIVSGMNLGFEEGLVLSLWNVSLSDPSSHWQGSTIADVIWASSTIGAVGGGLLGTTLGTTPGRASFVGSAGLWTGLVTGFAAAAFTGSGQDRAPTALLAADIGLNAGIVGGLLGASDVSPSIARVRFLDIGGIGGGLAFAGIYLAAAGKNPDAQAGFGATALGMASGLVVAWLATQSMPADRLDTGSASAPPPVSIQPILAPAPGGATLGVYGTL